MNDIDIEIEKKEARIRFNNRKLYAKTNLKRSMQVKEMQKKLYESEKKQNIPTNKENKKFTFYKYTLFSTGVIAIIISEISLRYASNSIFGLYFFMTFPLIVILSIFFFSYNKSKKNF